MANLHDEFDAIPDLAEESPKSSALDRVKSGGKDVLNFIKNHAPSKESIQDFGTGIQQGTTLGFSDEMGAAVQAALSKLTGVNKQDKELADEGFTGDLEPSAKDTFRKAQAVNQADVLNSQERSPKAALAGELLGGLASAIPTAGLGAEAAGSKIALSELLKQGGKGAVAKELAKRAGGAALAGAPLGIAQGVGSSQEGKLIDASPEELKALGKDAAIGGATGSALGAGVALTSAGAPLAAKYGKEGLDSILEKLKGNQTGRQVAKAFDIGKNGLEDIRLSPETGKPKGGKLYDLSGKDASENILKTQDTVANDVTKDVFGADKAISKNVGSVIDKATQNGVVIEPPSSGMKTFTDLNTFLDTRPNLLGSDETDKTVEALSRLTTGKMNPSEAQELKLTLGNALDGLDSTTDEFKVINRAYDALNNTIKEVVPGYQEANKLLAGYRGDVTESVLSKGKDAEFRKGFQSDKAFPKADFQNEMMGVVKELNTPGLPSDEKRRLMQKFSEGLDSFERENPGVLENAGVDKDSILAKLNDTADVSNIRKQIIGNQTSSSGPKGFIQSMSDLLSPKAAGFKAANMAGKVARKGENTIANFSKSFFQEPEQALMQHAQTLKQGSLPYLGDSLEKAIQNKDIAAKNAAMFAIMQNPKARRDLGMSMDEFDDNK